MYHQNKQTNIIFWPIANWNNEQDISNTEETPAQAMKIMYNGTRTEEQEFICQTINKDRLRSGIIYMKTWRGKTHIIFNLLEIFPVSTLILCHNIKVAHETKEKLLQFCNIKESSISLITSKSNDRETKEVTITTHKNFKDNFQIFQGKFKQIIYDECDVNISFPDRKNKGNCMVASIIMSDADIIWWLTWTPYRDNMAPDILTKLFGNLIYQPDQENNWYNMIPDIIQIKHDAKPYLWSTWWELIKLMWEDEERREHQQDTIYKYHRQCSLVLFDSRAEVDTLFESLTNPWTTIIKMYWWMSVRETRESEQLLRESKNYIIVWTTDMMGRGVDIPSIDTIFMYSALKFKWTIVQAVWRCLRKSEDNKSPIVVDWCDIPLLAKQMRERTKSYKQEYGDTVSITKIKYTDDKSVKGAEASGGPLYNKLLDVT